MQLCNARGESITGVQCDNAKHQYVSFSLRPDQQIVGVYGYMDSNKFIRGFGFITSSSRAK